RRADIAEIADAVLQRLARRANAPAPQISPDAIQALQAYPFPGNVRELENVLERSLTLSTGGTISAEHIRLRSGVRPATTDAAAAPAAAVSPPVTGDTTLGNQLESIERDAIIKALEKTRYNKTAAAKLLGMSFRALRYRIKKLGIE
ncbi:MAG: helix-turn-helix domain-containing protein, partial [Steroidobacteraceae bacterium]